MVSKAFVQTVCTQLERNTGNGSELTFNVGQKLPLLF